VQCSHDGEDALNRLAAIKRFVRVLPPLAAASFVPVVSVAGAEFPVWILCLIVGIVTSLVLRPLFIAVGLDEWMTPRLLVYSSLALIVAYLCWLLAWR